MGCGNQRGMISLSFTSVKGYVMVAVAEHGERVEAIHRELDRLFASPEFRQSEQSKRLLRYLVDHTLDGNFEGLKERAIGTALFQLDAGYDTTENPIVRVRANEIRKRLVKHYQQVEDPAVRIEVPAGAYRVVFHYKEEVAGIPPVRPVETKKKLSRRLIAAAIGLVAAVSIVSAVYLFKTKDSLEDFWAPALRSSSPVILASGHPVVYRFSKDFQERLEGMKVDHFRQQVEILQIPKDLPLKGSDIVPIPNQYIGLGSAEALARLHGWFAKHDKSSDIRFGNDLTFTDLRRSPAVVLGAFQNRWTVEFMRGMRFIFDTQDGRPCVRDTKTNQIWHLPALREDGQTPEDYVLISRVLQAPSGEFVVAAAGITQYGGHTVAEVLTVPGYLEPILRKAGSGWQKKNMQILLHVRVISQTAGPPELVALHTW